MLSIKANLACFKCLCICFWLQVQQSVFTVLPSKPDIRPGMVLMFELFLLRGDVVATDRVVAWGSFPVSNAEFDVIEGK